MSAPLNKRKLTYWPAPAKLFIDHHAWSCIWSTAFGTFTNVVERECRHKGHQCVRGDETKKNNRYPRLRKVSLQSRKTHPLSRLAFREARIAFSSSSLTTCATSRSARARTYMFIRDRGVHRSWRNHGHVWGMRNGRRGCFGWRSRSILGVVHHCCWNVCVSLLLCAVRACVRERERERERERKKEGEREI